MKRLTLSVLLFLPVLSFAQQEAYGDWPEPEYKKFPAEFQYTSLTEIAHGDVGWFDDYVHAVMVDHNNRIWLAGRYGLAYSDNGGLKWEQSFNRYSVCDVFETRKQTLLASSDNSYAMRSLDGGKTWSHLKVFGNGGPTGRSSHGERYTDVFYVQMNDSRIVRTCQYSEKLLLTDNEGKTWRIVEGPDSPESIHNIGDSIAIMFTYDEMYISNDAGETWKKSHKGLPKPEDPVYEVIDCGCVMEDGTIMALVDEQIEDVYERHAWFYDLKKQKWVPDSSGRTYQWAESSIYAIGNNRLLLYDFRQNAYSVSFDKGRTWGRVTGDRYMDYIQDMHVANDNIYFVSSATLYLLHLPGSCMGKPNEIPPTKQTYIALSDSLKNRCALVPVKYETSCDDFCMHQKCARSGPGYSTFIMHIPNDTFITVFNIIQWEGDVKVIEETFDIYSKLAPGDYELWINNQYGWSGAYFLQCRFKNETMEEMVGTTCYFY